MVLCLSAQVEFHWLSCLIIVDEELDCTDRATWHLLFTLKLE